MTTAAPTTPDHRALMAKAIQEIKDLKAKVRRLEAERAEPIAIVGMACRFPGGANSPDAYWQMLREGVDAIREIPPERWDVDRFYDPDRNAPGKAYTRNGGFVDDIAGFDAAFFNISPREADSLDPHQRILLEVCWEALEHANLVPEALYGQNAGVYIGVSSLDQILNRIGEVPLSEIGPYHGTGCALAPIAGRVSYNFGFNGPSFVMDTACSSSLLSLHLASEGLRRRECDLALAGGVHFLFHPGYFVAFSKASMLAPDGRCKTFDAAANGYARGEGCGVMVLKRLEDAQRDGDAILALIRGSAVNQDGASGGLTVPSGPSQEQVVRQALARGGIDPARVSYIEAHGTGTPLGDPIEIGALGNVFRQPLMVGSVKTNIGHLEASAGIAGAMKVVLALGHRQIPPHLHLKHPNPLIPWSELPITVPTRLTPWPTPVEGERVAGISAFAFSGTNCHLVLSEAPATPVQAGTPGADAAVTGSSASTAPYLLLLSARSPDAVRALARAWADGPLAAPDADWPGLCASAIQCRTAFSHRLALVAGEAASARQALLQFAETGTAAGLETATPTRARPKVAFLFTGQGAQTVGMGQALYATEPVFRAALEQCDRLLRAELDIPLLELLYPTSGDPGQLAERLDATGNTQPALFALEYALAQLWLSWGVNPAALVGHSVGEYVAACLAGVFSLEDGLKLIAARGRLMQALPAGGAMAAVLADAARVEAAIAGTGLAVAAYNGPRNCVLSGLGTELDPVLARLEAEGLEVRRLQVSHAFHSALMEPMLDAFRAVAESIRYLPARIPVISNVSGTLAGPEIAQADYWVRHVRAPVRFAQGVAALVAQGCDLLLEVGPAAILTGMARQNLDEQPEIHCIPSLRRREPDASAIHAALGACWLRGVEFPWRTVFGPPRRDLRLPTYPFQRRPYWHPSRVDAARDSLEGVVSLDLPLLARRFNSPLLREQLFETVFAKSALPFIEDHRVFGQLVVAGASHLSLVLSAAGVLGQPACSLRDILFPMALVVPEEGARVVQLVVSPAVPGPENRATEARGSEFRLVSLNAPGQEPSLHARGRIEALSADEQATRPVLEALEALAHRCPEVIPVDSVYELQRQRHIVVGASYQWLQSMHRGEDESIARFRVPPLLAQSIERYSLHPGLIDSCFGAMVMTRPITVDESFIPFALEALHRYPAPADPAHNLIAHARVRRQDALRVVGDIHLYTEQGQPVAAFIGLEGRRASRQALLSAGETRPQPALYGLAWEPLTNPTQPLRLTGRWLLLRPADALAESVAAALRAAGADLVELLPSEADEANLRARLDAAGALNGVINLWGLAGLTDEAQGLLAYAQAACASTLTLLQALAGRSATDGGRLPVWLVTRGAQAVRADDPVSAPHQALLWGLGQVARQELQELDCLCLDLDDGTDTGRCVLDLMTALTVDRREDRLAWRDGAGRCARLAPLPAPTAEFAAERARVHVITGASGALGQALALWLAEHGARHLALLARSPLADAFLARLGEAGAVACSYAVDVADGPALANVLERIRREQAAIGAVYHLAGQLDDGVLAGQTWARWQPVLAAKAEAAWHLHHLTLADRPSTFVCFSSVASLLGTAGQSSYAAANAFLDALCWRRQAGGLAALSLNWGPWLAGGMAAQVDMAQQARWAAAGVHGLPPEQALAMLGRLLGGAQVGSAPAHAQLGVLAMDWSRYAALGARPLLGRLLETAPADAGSGLSWRERLRQAGAGERKALITELLIELVAESLRLSPQEIAPRERLFDLGVDSLIAVELKNRLQGKLEMTLSTTLLFDYPSIEALAAYLLESLAPAERVTQAAVPGAPEHDQAAETAVDELSEAEAEALLLAQLERLEGQQR